MIVPVETFSNPSEDKSYSVLSVTHTHILTCIISVLHVLLSQVCRLPTYYKSSIVTYECAYKTVTYSRFFVRHTLLSVLRGEQQPISLLIHKQLVQREFMQREEKKNLCSPQVSQINNKFVYILEKRYSLLRLPTCPLLQNVSSQRFKYCHDSGQVRLY